jgi:peptide methionine sulfoxide reductase msrA/msrB
MPENGNKSSDIPAQNLQIATFAGGCFWCMQAAFDKAKGVVFTAVGYTGGHKENPTYEDVCSGKTGHTEAVEILYNPSLVSYQELLDIFWKNIEPTRLNRQFVDFGTQYRTAIFYHNEEQRRLAQASKEKLEKPGKFYKPIVTEIKPASTFYKAEEHHQQYYKKNPIRYEFYEAHSGRSQYLKTIWSSEAKK